MKQARKLAAAFALFVAMSAWAAPSVHIDSVIQRWPWNNKVDITYTVSEGQDVSAEPAKFYRLEFTATIDGNVYTISGVTNVGASASSGTHTVTWNPPAGLKGKDCTMVAEMFDADAPSGDDYMVIYLEDDNGYAAGTVCYEGLLASQEVSNVRYNTDDYKTKRLVLRKVPAVGSLQYSGAISSVVGGNDRKNWNTTDSNGVLADRDYYAGVFPVTQYQYEKVYGSNPSSKKSEIAGNEVSHRPVETVSWTDLRGSASPTNALVADASGTFFQRLDAMTGLSGFDLPTEVMAEITQRSGGSYGSRYWWGSGTDYTYQYAGTNYCVCSENSGGSTVAVGSKLPNRWGLYDVSGNVYQWCLDDDSKSNMENNTNQWKPACNGTSIKRKLRMGASFANSITHANFVTSYRGSAFDQTAKTSEVGFRVFRIVP